MQLRWASVGRVAAIAAAVVAGVAGLPALLGSDRPPPVPADVGLAPPAEPADVVQAPAAEPAEVAQMPPPLSAHSAPKQAKHRLAKNAEPRSKQGSHLEQQRSRRRISADAAPADQVQTPAPMYEMPPTDSLPPESGEFRFER